MKIKKIIKKIFHILVYILAAFGAGFILVFFAIQFGWLNVRGSASERNLYFTLGSKVPQWASSDEWAVMKSAFTRDQETINRAARDAGVSPRILLGGVIGEQFRFFGNSREAFKRYFEPLKLLASLSNTSYGIAGLKPKTAQQIEEHLKDPTSPYYLGPDMENVISYAPGDDIEAVRFARITDVKDPYYSYLYVGLYMKQIQAQWQKAGYPIADRPDVLGTLYNLGFYYSVPKAHPLSGGSTILVDGVPYAFGDLSYQFYYSQELSDIFPFGVK